MALSSNIAKIILVAAMLAAAAEALTCGTVSGKLAPCITYARGKGAGGPSAGCCEGIKGLNKLASTTKDRQDACNCLQEAARTIKDINLSLVEGLPGKCGVNIPYKISPSTDCAKVK